MTVPVLGSWQFPTRTVLLVLGVASFVGALVLAFLPFPLDPLRPIVAPLANEAAVVLLGLLGAIVGLRHLLGMDEERTDSPGISGTPEEATYNAREATGGDIDRTIENLDGLPASRTANWWETHERLTVEEPVHALAVDVLVRTDNLPTEEAERRIERGEWTDDVRAANFLGGGDVPELPLRMQLYDWLSGRAYERHVRHTVDEIAERADLLEVETE